MLTMNRATLLGHAGRNPEMRKLPSGDDVALFSLATTERFRRRDGTDGEDTEWHAVVAYGAAAEAVRKMLRKGDRVLVEGRIATRYWRDRTGTERRTTEIVVSGPQARVNVLTKRRQEPDGDDEPPGGAAPAATAGQVDPEPRCGRSRGPRHGLCRRGDRFGRRRSFGQRGGGRRRWRRRRRERRRIGRRSGCSRKDSRRHWRSAWRRKPDGTPSCAGRRSRGQRGGCRHRSSVRRRRGRP